jgi:dynein heavy chain
MRIREERDAKRATMDGRHEYILTTVADRLGMTVDDAEEFMLDGDQVLNYL